MRLVIVSIRVDVVAKIDNEAYVLSIIKIYNYFSFGSLLGQRRLSCWKYRKLCSYFEKP